MNEEQRNIEYISYLIWNETPLLASQLDDGIVDNREINSEWEKYLRRVNTAKGRMAFPILETFMRKDFDDVKYRLNQRGQTFLYLAARKMASDIVALLLENGVGTEISNGIFNDEKPNSKGDTPIIGFIWGLRKLHNGKTITMEDPKYLHIEKTFELLVNAKFDISSIEQIFVNDNLSDDRSKAAALNGAKVIVATLENLANNIFKQFINNVNYSSNEKYIKMMIKLKEIISLCKDYIKILSSPSRRFKIHYVSPTSVLSPVPVPVPVRSDVRSDVPSGVPSYVKP
jgi:hypothetical protein